MSIISEIIIAIAILSCMILGFIYVTRNEND